MVSTYLYVLVPWAILGKFHGVSFIDISITEAATAWGPKTLLGVPGPKRPVLGSRLLYTLLFLGLFSITFVLHVS